MHIVSAIVLWISLVLLYGGVVPGEKLEPILIPSTLGVLLGMLLMGWMVLRAGARENQPA